MKERLMKNVYLPAFSLLVLVLACAGSGPNPFDSDWNTPFGTPPFDRIRTGHYKPAIKKGISLENKEIEAIVRNPEVPTFKNTLEALDFSGEYLSRVSNVFDNMTGSMTNDTMQALDKELAPLRSAHRDDILLNAGLFKRIKAVYDSRDTAGLNPEQNRVLEEMYKRFVRNGANLGDADKDKLRKINEELSVLSVQFGENVLKENNKFELVLEKQDDLAGLPAAVVRQMGVHAPQAQPDPLPPILRKTRSPRENVHWLRHPGRSRRRAGQQQNPHADGVPARGQGETARLRHFRRPGT
jgi:Zn-dependent oligopeptidase